MHYIETKTFSYSFPVSSIVWNLCVHSVVVMGSEGSYLQEQRLSKMCPQTTQPFMVYNSKNYCDDKEILKVKK